MATKKPTRRPPAIDFEDASENRHFILMYKGNTSRVHAQVTARNPAEACSAEIIANDFEDSPMAWIEVAYDDDNGIYHVYEAEEGWKPTDEAVKAMHVTDVMKHCTYITTCALTPEALQERSDYLQSLAITDLPPEFDDIEVPPESSDLDPQQPPAEDPGLANFEEVNQPPPEEQERIEMPDEEILPSTGEASESPVEDPSGTPLGEDQDPGSEYSDPESPQDEDNYS